MKLIRTRNGLTLIEMLVVLGIIVILFSLMLCAVQATRAASQKTQCTNNLVQIGIALHSYHTSNESFPPGLSTQPEPDGSTYFYLSWSPRILPYLEQTAIWDQTVQAFAQEPNFNKLPHPIATVLPIFGCPADSRTARLGRFQGFPVGLTSYLGVEGKNLFRQNGVLYRDSHVRLVDITDGSSTTLMVGERPPSADEFYGWWYGGVGQFQSGSLDTVLGVRERNRSYRTPDCPSGPYAYGPGKIDNMCDVFHFWSLHQGGANFLFADGSVHFLLYSADPIMPALATRAGGESVSLP